MEKTLPLEEMNMDVKTKEKEVKLNEGFSPSYKKLNEYFGPNTYSVDCCRCNPARC